MTNQTRISVMGLDPLEGLVRAVTVVGRDAPRPPCDIQALDEDRYALTMAVAGFNEDELSISTQGRGLTVSGRKSVRRSDSGYLLREISVGDFEQTFQLAPYVEVQEADLRNGLLRIELVRDVPQALRPRRIEIKTAEPQRLLESSDSHEKSA